MAILYDTRLVGGEAGKSAYEYALEGGYAGTETEFAESLGDMGDIGITFTRTLTSGETSLTITDNRITVDSVLNNVYTSKFGMSVKSAVFGEGTLTLTFKAQEEDITVKVVINAILSLGGNGLDGKDGKSAYEYAVEGGYSGTEEEFAQLFNNMSAGGGEWTEISSSCIDTSSAGNRKINLDIDDIKNGNYEEILIIAKLSTSYTLTFVITKKELEYLKNNYTNDTTIRTYYDGSSQSGLWFIMSSGIMRFNIVGTPTINAYYR